MHMVLGTHFIDLGRVKSDLKPGDTKLVIERPAHYTKSLKS